MNFSGTGTLTRDPESKHLPSGTAVTEFGIACNRKDGKGEKVADFFECKAWSFAAEKAALLRKGQSVVLAGTLNTESWEDKATGAKRSKTVLTCWDIGVQPDTRPAARKPATSQPDARAEDFPAMGGARSPAKPDDDDTVLPF